MRVRANSGSTARQPPPQPRRRPRSAARQRRSTRAGAAWPRRSDPRVDWRRQQRTGETGAARAALERMLRSPRGGADESPRGETTVGAWEFSGTFCVGRSRGCEVSIATSEETRTVSKRHVAVVPLAESRASSARAGAGVRDKRRWMLYDLETMNGTAVNGVELPSGGTQELRDGDEVVLASAMRQCVRLVIHFPDDTCERILVKALARVSPPPTPQRYQATPRPLQELPDEETAAVAAPMPTPSAIRPSFVVDNAGAHAVATEVPAAPHSLPQKRNRSGVKRDTGSENDSENRELNHQEQTPSSQQRKRSRRGEGQEQDDSATSAAAKSAQEHDRQERERLMVCPVCLEYFHGSATLPCSHTFCNYCISNWFRTSLSCPECRDVVRTVPVRNRALDELVERLVGQTEAYKSHVKRRARLQRRSAALAASVMARRDRQDGGEGENGSEDAFEGAALGVGSLQLGGNGFTLPNLRANVFSRWSVEDKLAFSAYVSGQFGEARANTCKKVGLTEAAVDGANVTELLIAAQNLLLDCGGLRIVGDECCQRLKIFLLFG